MGNETSGLDGVIALFRASCDTFAHLVLNADEVADATDFTGKLHDLSLTAGRVQGLGEALAVFSGDSSWRDRVDATLREYLGSSSIHGSNGREDPEYPL